MLRDLFYSTRQNLYELFKIGMTGASLDLEGFLKIVGDSSENMVPESDSNLAWSVLPKNRHGKVTFEVFEQTFKSEIPTNSEFETKVIRTVREWLFQSKLSSEMAFDSLCRAAGRFVERSLTRAQFHKAIQTCEVGLTAAQVDTLFANLTDEAGGVL